MREGRGGLGVANEDGDADWREGRVNAAAAAGSQLCRKQLMAQTAEKYAESTSIWFKYCEGSTRFTGHFGIHIGWGAGVLRACSQCGISLEQH